MNTYICIRIWIFTNITTGRWNGGASCDKFFMIFYALTTVYTISSILLILLILWLLLSLCFHAVTITWLFALRIQLYIHIVITAMYIYLYIYIRMIQRDIFLLFDNNNRSPVFPICRAVLKLGDYLENFSCIIRLYIHPLIFIKTMYQAIYSI